MRTRVSLAVLALASAGAIGSLYAPWAARECRTERCREAARTFEMFADFATVDGWTLSGVAVALCAIALLAACVLVATGRRQLDDVPLGRLALTLVFLTVATVLQTRAYAASGVAGGAGPPLRYGAALGLLAAGAALVVAAVHRRRELSVLKRPATFVASAGAALIVVGYLLPWADWAGDSFYAGISPLAAAVVAIWIPARAADGARILAPALAGAGLMLAGVVAGVPWQYAAFLREGVASGIWVTATGTSVLVGLGLSRIRARPRIDHVFVTGAAALLLPATLFAPWRTECFTAPELADLPPETTCFDLAGWAIAAGAWSGVVAALVFTLDRRHGPSMRLGLALAACLLAVTGVAWWHALDIRYGAVLGMAAATTFMAAVVFTSRRSLRVERKRLLVRGLPLLAGATYLGLLLVPAWFDLARRLPLLEPAVVVACLLLLAWCRRTVSGAAPCEWLWLLPLALAAIDVLPLIQAGPEGMSWLHGAALATCGVLFALGLVEDKTGLEAFRIPEVLRIDRI